MARPSLPRKAKDRAKQQPSDAIALAHILPIDLVWNIMLGMWEELERVLERIASLFPVPLSETIMY